ncbi:MAG TPA: cytochrome P450 [Myxococcales bacterium]|nr:cytochrome P450 [Myxococcales bacterium]
MNVEAIDLAAPAFKRDPYPFYARLRAKEPVKPVKLRDGRTIWLITRYADVAAALKDDRFGKDRFADLTVEEQKRHLPWMPAFVRPLATNMLDSDPPRHTRLRALVQKAFTASYVEKLRGRIEGIAHELIDEMLVRGRADLVADFALPIPLRVISDMLGVPQAVRGKFAAWSRKTTSISTGADALLVIPVLWRFLRFVRGLIRDRQRAPGEDLLSQLVRAEEAGDRLSDDELVSMVFLLLVAGHETTVNLISSGTLELIRHPQARERLRAEPGLVRTAVEELLRYTSPVEWATERYTLQPVSYGGVEIPKGERVQLVLGSANRDESQFPRPDELDLGRDPNRHLAFGHGIHYCVGAPLARLESGIAFRALLERCSELELGVAEDQLKWRRGVLLRGLRTFPIQLRAAQRRAVA